MATRSDPAPQEKVVPLRHPGTWVASGVVLLVVALAADSVVTNQAFQWPVVAVTCSTNRYWRDLLARSN